MKARALRQQNGETGTALVEFSITVVVMLILLFGVVDVGRAAFAYDWVSNAARQGARYAIVRGAFCQAIVPGCPANQAAVQNYVTSNAPGIKTTDVTVNTHCIVSGTSFGLLPCAPGTTVYVQVQYSFSFITPFLSQLHWVMSSSSEMVDMQ
jgi:Flp pilus assembly protein TadG